MKQIPKIGDVIRLKKRVRERHKCPVHGVNNNTAIIRNVYGEGRNEIMTYEDLHGSMFWKRGDVVLIEGKPTTERNQKPELNATRFEKRFDAIQKDFTSLKKRPQSKRGPYVITNEDLK